MITLEITSQCKRHVARCSFGSTEAGSPLDSMDAFLAQLKSGKIERAPSKISKSESPPTGSPPWTPLDCGLDLGDNFVPFIGKKLKRVNRTAFIAEIVMWEG